MPLPDRIFAHASPRSLGASLVSEFGRTATRRTVGGFRSAPGVSAEAAARLADAGFEVLQISAFSINIAGDPDVFGRALGVQIVTREIDSPEGASTFLDSPETDRLGLMSTGKSRFAASVEGVALEVPRRPLGIAADPPATGYFHLRPPEDLARLTSADRAHALGIDGAGVQVAMIDSGWFRHPYFTSRGYDVAPVVLGPAATAPEHDESGHGTGESANILALAPGCRLLPVKINFVNSIGAFNAAVALGPQIITCSWGSNSPFQLSAADQVLAASIAAAVAQGITVIFSAGNGHAGFPGQHPDVISAGGVFVDENGLLQAADYASGFVSNIYPGRVVPDVSGLVGMRPKAMYIMLPVEPGDQIDVGNAGGSFPDGDETAPDDGWAAFSGTSAAAPQLAGAAALLAQTWPGITPETTRQALVLGATDCAAGFCSPVPPLHGGLPAAPGFDVATGAGLVDSFASLFVPLWLGGGTEMAAGDAESGAEQAYLMGLAAGLAWRHAQPA